MTASPPRLEVVRHALYAGPRATFVERRKELAGAARSAGDRDGAKVILAMPKPTAAAHLVNLLANAGDNSLVELVQLGAGIRRAMAGGDDHEMRSLLKGRAAALAKTAAQAQNIAQANGESVSGPTGAQVAQLLRAAMASDDAAAAVRSGTLVDTIDEPDFGDFTIERATNAPVSARSGVRKSRTGDSRVEAGRTEAADRAAAQQKIKAARAELTQAELTLSTTQERRDGFEAERVRLVSHLAVIDDQVSDAQAEVDAAQAAVGEATGRLQAVTGAASG